MTLNRGAQRAMIAIFFAVLAAIYVAAWLAPGVGFEYEDAVHLVSARAIAGGQGYTVASLPQPVPQTQYPPLFPALLALFTLISEQPQWLKLLPLACAAGWLFLMRRLLLKMGASRNAALLLVGLTAASPTVVALSTNLFPECVFALLATAALILLLEDRALLSGIFAGLATLTLTPGLALIAACILTLVARRRFRSGVIFAAVAMVIAAPWFGWSLAQAARGAHSAPSTIFTGLAASEKLVVLGHNVFLLLAAPFSLLTGLTNTFSISATVLVLAWCFIVRRQLVPDLFVAFYGVALLFRTWPPERSVATILPLILWIVWRVARLIPVREALAAAVLIATIGPLGIAVSRIPAARANGYFAASGAPADNWDQAQRLFGAVRENTAPGDVLLANLDAAVYLNTGRRAVRGFTPNGFDLYYAPRQSAITPDQLSRAIVQSRVSYLVLTPDNGLAESAEFHKSVEALERGGIVEPVAVSGLARAYRLLRVVR